jgi:hypothetical protein
MDDHMVIMVYDIEFYKVDILQSGNYVVWWQGGGIMVLSCINEIKC